MHDDMISPRVFISYARSDGEVFATKLRERLEREEPEITLWQDRARMEGGVGWWKQITDALERVQFLVLIVTPGSLESDVVQKEWRYARQQGVCVYPVNAAPGGQLNFEKMPRWMSRADFFDLDHEWQTFVNYLKSPCHALRVPFMPPDLPKHLVNRQAPYGRLLDCVLDAQRDNPLVTTVALHGAGGLGKTTLAAQLCHHDDVITAYTDGILWATLGEKPNILPELTKLYAAITGKRPQFVNADDAAIELSKSLADRQFLLVIDDVWDSSHLAPFRRGGELCTRLVTTRQLPVALVADEHMRIDEMTTDEATTLLTGYLDAPPPDQETFESLAQRLGEWPLLLELAGGALKQRLARGDTLDGAVAYLNQALDKVGVVAFDQRNPQERHQAFARTISVSLDLLSEDERSQYRSLVIFPADVSVPLSTVETLLRMEEFDTVRVAQTLDDLSLLQLDLNTPPMASTLRLHDVIRTYLASELDSAPELHARLGEAWTAPEQLPDDYAWRYAAFHMAAALPDTDADERHCRTKRLVELVTNPNFQEGHRQHVADPPALERDLNRALECAVEDGDKEAPMLVIRAALNLGTLEGLQPEQLFELAEGGELGRAESLLDLFKPEWWWRQAVLLTLAWQAAAAKHDEEALALLARLKQEVPTHDRVLEPLVRRVRSRVEPGVVLPPSNLPSAPDLLMVSSILERLGGTSLEPMLHDPALISGLQQMGDEAPAYLAEQDGPLLVAFAEVDPEHHTSYLKRYIALLASNPYRQYRNRSLWALIPSIVQHPDSAWILEVLRELMSGALTHTNIDFQSALPLAVRGLRARYGDAAALQALEDDRKNTVERVQTLSLSRGEEDPWAHELRRLAALAEVYFRVLERPDEANHLLDEALILHHSYNFAGFRAPACLTLAESLLLCGRHGDEYQTVGRAIQEGLAAAHNIQDAEFCAQTTARVNAMQERWWPATLDTPDIASTIVRFTQDPQQPAFSPLHRVGDTYQHRVVPDRLPLPSVMRTARTVREITRVYPSMRLKSEAEVLALNPERPEFADQPLSEGTQVNIIDPEFAPLMAARLAAEALVAGRFSDPERALMIQRLVPLSVANRTALDAVAARLLMAVPQNAAALDSLSEAMEEAGVHG